MSKILVCIPAMDMVATGFAQSLAMLQKGGHETAIALECGSLIYDSRNKLAKRAIEMGAEYTMWFDSDMIFEPDTMTRLLAHDSDIVSGIYFRRNPPFTPVAFETCDVQNRKWTDVQLKDDKTISVEGIGFGCVLIKTDVLFDVASRFGTWFEPINGFGEDLAFCWRARECGYEIKLDPTVKCGHVGHIVVTDSFYKAYQGGKNDESKS